MNREFLIKYEDKEKNKESQTVVNALDVVDAMDQFELDLDEWGEFSVKSIREIKEEMEEEMAIKVKTTYVCDICNSENDYNCERNMQVIFYTEQTEGRSVKPYLSKVDMCVCNECLAVVLEGNYIHAHGAMGCNKYYLKGLGLRS